MKKIIFSIIALLQITIINAQIQFTNGNFETTITDCMSCTQQDIDCVEGWSFHWGSDFAPPLFVHEGCESGLVCEGEGALRLATDQGRASVITANPYFMQEDVNDLPKLISMKSRRIDGISSPVFIQISGDDGLLGVEPLSPFGFCDPLSVMVPSSIVNSENLIFSAGDQFGNHFNLQIFTFDEIEVCGDIFTIEEQCIDGNKQIVFDLNHNCPNNLELYFYLDLIEPSGDRREFGEDLDQSAFPWIISDDLEAGEYTFEFVGSINGVPSEYQIPFHLNDLCCSDFLPCSIETDLTACAQENEFGYITLSCEEGNAPYEFIWNHNSSTAIVESTSDMSSLRFASEGSYRVKVVDHLGCEYIEWFNVAKDCTPEPFECVPPSNLNCSSTFGTQFSWTNLPGASGYYFQYIPNSRLCCEGEGKYWESFYSESNSVTLDEIFPQGAPDCFSWRVITDCGGEELSTPSEIKCYPAQCFSLQFRNSNLLENAAEHSINISPNPFTNNISLSFHSNIKETYNIDMYDLQGRKVYTSKINVSIGENTKELPLSEGIRSGMYLLSLTNEKGERTTKLISKL